MVGYKLCFVAVELVHFNLSVPLVILQCREHYYPSQAVDVCAIRRKRVRVVYRDGAQYPVVNVEAEQTTLLEEKYDKGCLFCSHLPYKFFGKHSATLRCGKRLCCRPCTASVEWTGLTSSLVRPTQCLETFIRQSCPSYMLLNFMQFSEKAIRCCANSAVAISSRASSSREFSHPSRWQSRFCPSSANSRNRRVV